MTSDTLLISLNYNNIIIRIIGLAELFIHHSHFLLLHQTGSHKTSLSNSFIDLDASPWKRINKLILAGRDEAWYSRMPR